MTALQWCDHLLLNVPYIGNSCPYWCKITFYSLSYGNPWVSQPHHFIPQNKFELPSSLYISNTTTKYFRSLCLYVWIQLCTLVFEYQTWGSLPVLEIDFRYDVLFILHNMRYPPYKCRFLQYPLLMCILWNLDWLGILNIFQGVPRIRSILPLEQNLPSLSGISTPFSTINGSNKSIIVLQFFPVHTMIGYGV